MNEDYYLRHVSSLCSLTNKLMNCLEQIQKDSYEKKAIYAFISEWYGITYGIGTLLQLGMSMQGNNIMILTRTALEVFSQFCFLTSDESTILKKSIYAFLGTNFNNALYNKELGQVLRENKMLIEGGKKDCGECVNVDMVLNFNPTNDENIQMIIEEFRKKADSKRNKKHIYWYELYNEEGRLGPASMVKMYGSDIVGESCTESNQKFMLVVYNLLSQQAHGISALTNKDYGREDCLPLLVKILDNMYRRFCIECRKYYPDEIDAYYSTNKNEIFAMDIFRKNDRRKEAYPTSG